MRRVARITGVGVAGPTYLKVPSLFVHAPGLFRSLQKGERKKLKLDITYDVELSTFAFHGPELLDSTDLRVLQGLLAHATAHLWQAKQLLRDGRTTRAALELAGDAVRERVIAARFNLTRFVESIGYAKGGSARKIVMDSIERLSTVTVAVLQPGFEGSFRALSSVCQDAASGELVVGLSPMLTAAVFARGNFIAVSLAEARALKSDLAHLLHWRLHWINQRTVGQVGIEKLCGYVYPLESASIPTSTTRRRRLAVRNALNELSGISWSITEAKIGVYEITRPKHGVSVISKARI